MAVTDAKRGAGIDADSTLPGKTSRSQLIVEYMKEQILSGRWEAGARVEDSMIAAELGVSRNSVREAFGQLTLHRILEKHQWHGYYIPVMTVHEVEEIITIRKNLELLALDLFMQERQPEVLADIADSIRLSEEDINRDDITAFHRSDYVIHEIIHRHCGNSWIPMLISFTKFQIDTLRRLDKNTNFKEVANDSVAGHWRMLDAMKRDDLTSALHEMEAQIDRHRNRLVDAFNLEKTSKDRGKETLMT